MEITELSLPALARGGLVQRNESRPAPAHSDAGMLFGAPAETFARYCNRHSFRFWHALAQHPLFQLPALQELSRRRPDHLDYAYWSTGAVAPQDRWEKGMNLEPSLHGTIGGIAGNDSLVMLRHLQDDPVYAPLIGRLFSQLVALSGPRLGRDLLRGRATIILASPGRVTPYHIDAECNFLLQLSGHKQLSVCDQHNRHVISDRELEDFFAGDFNGAVYRKEHRAQAAPYRLGPGEGVHIPFTAPHWGVNGNEVSIALSLAFDLRSGERKTKIYQLNRRLRRHGLRPTPPGVSPTLDLVKLAAKNFSNILRWLQGRRADPASRWGWRPAAER